MAWGLVQEKAVARIHRHDPYSSGMVKHMNT